MPNKMLIDATHPEETRVVVLRGNRVEEFDFDPANRKQPRGNIYLAKVPRVEPSLQAAFVDYGGNRHGFLAFSEIHPDYYQIPVADRQALIEEEERAHREADAEADRGPRRSAGRRRRSASSRDSVRRSEPIETQSEGVEGDQVTDSSHQIPAAKSEPSHDHPPAGEPLASAEMHPAVSHAVEGEAHAAHTYGQEEDADRPHALDAAVEPVREQ